VAIQKKLQKKTKGHLRGKVIFATGAKSKELLITSLNVTYYTGHAFKVEY
jgi:hypothetical protein